MRIRWLVFSFRKYVLLRYIVTISIILWSFYVLINTASTLRIFTHSTPPTYLSNKTLIKSISLNKNRDNSKRIYDAANVTEYRRYSIENKVKRLSQLIKNSRVLPLNNGTINFAYSNVHIFYYAWYGNIDYDNDWNHWNHNYIPNWKKGGKTKVYRKRHEAPLDIGSNYYPSLGCYSSRNPETISIHMKQLKDAGVGVVVVSWAPPGMKDSPNDVLPSLFYYASEQNIKVTLHIEPYFNRSPGNLRQHLVNFFDSYADHPALYKINSTRSKKPLPLVYVYDSYLIPFSSWKELLGKNEKYTIRDTKYDAIFIGLIVDQEHRYHIKKSRFDGFYTYFATNGFTFGSTWKNWNGLAKFARQNHLLFIPSVGPGYIDIQIRPWNSNNARHRRNGQYYDVAWRSAIKCNTQFISVTSFNEWHEGTQIESAQPKTIPGYTYSDYSPEGSDFYLHLTKWWVNVFYNWRENHKNLF